MSTYHNSVIKQHLAKSVKLQNEGGCEDFAWKKQVPFPEFGLNGITVEGLGNIPIPVPLQDVQRLKEISKIAPHGKGYNKYFDPSKRQAWEIDSSKIADHFDLPMLITPHMGFSNNLMKNVKTKFDKLILYEIDGHYTHNLKSENVFGTIGTTTLQLPVEGGHEGGRVNVKYKGKSKLLENNHQSGEHFYVSTICGSCSEVMEPITSGWRLTFVFDLVWINSKTRIPLCFPIFLTALKEIEEALESWIHPNQNQLMTKPSDATSENKTHVEEATIPAGNPTKDEQSNLLVDSSEDELDDGLADDDDMKYLDEVACKEDLLFFVLQEKYEENDISFHSLRGKDRDLATLLQNCVFLDVHLAMVTSNILRNGYYGRSSINELKSAEVSRWIDSNDVIRNLTMNRLHWKKQRVGSNRNFLATCRLSRDGFNSDTKKSYGVVMRQHDFYHCILVIWPKHQSIEMYCRYGPHSLLSRMESLLCNEKDRQQVIRDLGEIISFCCAEPLKVWKANPPKTERKGEFTLKLLHLCITLGAREEGLALLKMLGADFATSNSKRQQTTTYEGIQNEDVAKAIAEFECEVTGWEDCAHLIQKMISPNRILPQFLAIVKLAQYLFDFDCLDGANMVADCISSTIANLDKLEASNLEQSGVENFFNLIVSLESDPKTSNLVRLVSFISLFPKLHLSVQCRVVLDLETQCNSRLKGIESCHLLLLDLSKALSETCQSHSSSVLDFIEDLICCYIRLGNSTWLHSLISNICRAPPTSRYTTSYDSSLRRSLLDKVASSPILWEFATSSELGKSAMTSIVEDLLTSLIDKILSFGYAYSEDQLSLVNCLNFMMKLDRNPNLSDPKRVSSIPSLLAKLGVKHLCDLMVDFVNNSSGDINDRPSDLAIFNQIFESLLARLTDKPIDALYYQEKIQSVLMTCLIHLKNEAMARSLLQRICANKFLVKTWENQCRLFNRLVNSKNIWEKLDNESRMIILNTSISLLESWLLTIIKRMDKIGRTYEQGAQGLKSEISCSIELFLLVEKNRCEPEQKNVADAFQPLYQLLPTSHLMDIVLEIHQSEAKAHPNFKKFPHCFNWYRDMCRAFFGMTNWIALVSTNDLAIKIVHCLVWLGDEQSWQSFAQQFCRSFPSDQCHHFVLVFVNNFVVHRALFDSPPAICAFNLIVDHLKKPTSVLKEPPFTWQQPQAVISGHSDVQNFLRGNEEKMTYQNFSSIVEAREFAIELERNGPTNGFSVRASATGSAHYSRVIISKNKNHHFQAVKAFQTKQSELNELMKLHQNLQEHSAANGEDGTNRPTVCSKLVVTEEITISSPSKRRKLDTENTN